MFNKDYKWLENCDEATLNKQDIIDYIAKLFEMWEFNDDPQSLWIESREEWDWEWEQDTYEKSLAVSYLENVYNKESNYSPTEQLLYLSWVYSRL